ncbi:MFS sugar transporter [Aspergillus pseudotamarii]|uniref:MFS sugar transporter n=1 Tax=Aspergillus pseudotamarii TaxID=132259 RepID=A0A5N6TBR4_ASPPS|nr:MFS sugar transporter [Aspergillus pseudotamarii]KAE8143815.1 MFS sugar transporter [Aspergillus pseudotamarii]
MPHKSSWFKPGFHTQLAITANCLHAFFLFGYDQGVFGGLISNPDFLNTVNHPSDGLLGFIVSSYNLGCLSGCVLTFIIGGRLGRRPTLWLAMITLSIGAIIQTSAYGVPQMIVGRIVAGLGVGIDTATVPMYQAELCKAAVRGRMVTTEVLFTALGITVAYFFAFGMDFVGGAIAWRLPIAAQILPAFIISIVLFGLPETPRWLIERGRVDEAVQVMCQVYGVGPEDESVQHETREILGALANESEVDFHWSRLFKNDRVQTRRRVGLALLVLSFNQWVGINVVVFYIAVVLEESVGLSRQMALIAGGCINLAFALGSLVPALFLDRIGRKRPMIIGSIGMGLSLAAISVLLSFQGTNKQAVTGKACIAFFVTYMIFFGTSLNAIPWCYAPEILPLKARAKGISLAVFVNWASVFLIVMVTPTMIANITWKTYLVFMACNFAIAPAIYFWFPETSRLSLEEIDLLFIDSEEHAAATGNEASNVGEKNSTNTSLHIEHIN